MDLSGNRDMLFIMETKFDPQAFIARVMTQIGVDAQLDVMYDGICDLSREKRHGDIDALLSAVDVAQTLPDLLIGYLTITCHCSKRLPNRCAFFDKCVETANAKGWNEPRLFDGLSGRDVKHASEVGSAMQMLLGIENSNKEG